MVQDAVDFSGHCSDEPDQCPEQSRSVNRMSADAQQELLHRSIVRRREIGPPAMGGVRNEVGASRNEY
jgi:hypothetical protein